MRTLTHKQINRTIRKQFRAKWFDCRMTELFDDGALKFEITGQVPAYQTDAINKISYRFSKYVLEALMNQLCKEGKLSAGTYRITGEDNG